MVMFNYDYIIGQLSKIYNLQVNLYYKKIKTINHKLCNENLLGHC